MNNIATFALDSETPVISMDNAVIMMDALLNRNAFPPHLFQHPSPENTNQR
jgi:hypothetical protein